MSVINFPKGLSKNELVQRNSDVQTEEQKIRARLIALPESETNHLTTEERYDRIRYLRELEGEQNVERHKQSRKEVINKAKQSQSQWHTREKW